MYHGSIPSDFADKRPCLCALFQVLSNDQAVDIARASVANGQVQAAVRFFFFFSFFVAIKREISSNCVRNVDAVKKNIGFLVPC